MEQSWSAIIHPTGGGFTKTKSSLMDTSGHHEEHNGNPIRARFVGIGVGIVVGFVVGKFGLVEIIVEVEIVGIVARVEEMGYSW
ncbi:hypothetical protein Tco_1361823 [Tanacetum coccineum]